MMKEILAKAKPGQWILVNFNYGPEYEWREEMEPLFKKSITKEWLDQLAPNNPVKVKGGFLPSVINQKAIEELRSVHPTLSVIYSPGEMMDVDRFLKTGGGFTRAIEPDAMFKGNLPKLAAILKAEMELWASWGFTTFTSGPYAYNNFLALDYLDKKAEMPARWAWGYSGPDFDEEVLHYFAGMLGHGTDYLWFIGMWERIGSDCSTVPVRAEWLKTHQMGSMGTRACNFAPGSEGRKILERIIATGNRVATMHTGGDKDIDYFMDAIEQASQRAGMTLEEIRAKRHAMDHSSDAPRLDQITRMKKLGMVASLNHGYIWQPGGHASQVAEIYGSEYTSWVGPRKSLTEAGIPTGFEMDRPFHRQRREAWQEQSQLMDPRQWVFVDESGATTEMTRRYGRAPRGERVREATPAGHWSTLTLLGAMSTEGLVATMTVESPTDGEVFLAYLEHVLCPRLEPGQIVVMDNLSAHTVQGVRQLIEATGAQLLYLPPYSPDCNPIEQCWGKVKQKLRSLKARTVDALEQAISEAIATITPNNASAWFAHCGYDLQ